MSLYRWSVDPRGEGHNLLTIGWNLEPFKQTLTKFFYQHSQPLYDVMEKEIVNLDFVQSVNFEFIDSILNNAIKYLSVFDN